MEGSSDTNGMYWQTKLNKIRKHGVPNPYRGNYKEYKRLLKYALAVEDKMYPNVRSKFESIPYLNVSSSPGQEIPNYSQTNQLHLHQETRKPEKVIEKLMTHIFNGMNNPFHPNTQYNVLPHITNVATVAALFGMKLNPNIIDSHSSLNVAKAELELFSYLSHMLPHGQVDSPPSTGLWPPPWAPKGPEDKSIIVNSVPKPGSGSGGISTFGGTGCYLYAIKYSLTKVADSVKSRSGKGSRFEGFPQGKFVIMTSDQGHYCHSNITDWTGIGANNVMKIKTMENSTMSLEDLKLKLKEAKANGKVVVTIVATIGTTDATAIDDVKGIRSIVEKFRNNEGYRKPLIYCDSVAGWSWMFFANYNYKNNPEGFDTELLEKIKTNSDRVKNIAYADMFGVDFHKTAYCHFTASMFMLRDYGDYATTMQRPSPPYLQQEQYNVGLYSLETSRGCVGTVGPWATLNYFGQSGMRAIIYNLVLNQEIFRKKLIETKFIAVCNHHMVSYATLFRVYPFEVEDPQKYFEQEVHNPQLQERYMAVNAYQKLLYAEIRERLKNPLKKGDDVHSGTVYLKVPHLGISTGYRKVMYDMENCGKEYRDVHVLKSYTKTTFTNEKTMDDVLSVIKCLRSDIRHKMERKNVLLTGLDKVVPGKIPEGVNPQNNIIPPKFIPYQFFQPPSI